MNKRDDERCVWDLNHKDPKSFEWRVAKDACSNAKKCKHCGVWTLEAKYTHNLLIHLDHSEGDGWLCPDCTAEGHKNYNEGMDRW